MAGGYGGHLFADRIYYSRHPHIVKQAQLTGQVHAQDIQRFLPMLSVPSPPAPGQPQ